MILCDFSSLAILKFIKVQITLSKYIPQLRITKIFNDALTILFWYCFTGRWALLYHRLNSVLNLSPIVLYIPNNLQHLSSSSVIIQCLTYLHHLISPLLSYLLLSFSYFTLSTHRTIILFDEIEEFCLDRENPALGMESRMLTTAMLTQVCLWECMRECACVKERECVWACVCICMSEWVCVCATICECISVCVLVWMCSMGGRACMCVCVRERE